MVVPFLHVPKFHVELHPVCCALSSAQLNPFSRLFAVKRVHAHSTVPPMFLSVFFSCRADIETEADVASRLGVIFMSTMFVGVICLQTAIPAGVKERIVFYREQVCTSAPTPLYPTLTAGPPSPHPADTHSALEENTKCRVGETAPYVGEHVVWYLIVGFVACFCLSRSLRLGGQHVRSTGVRHRIRGGRASVHPVHHAGLLLHLLLDHRPRRRCRPVLHVLVSGSLAVVKSEGGQDDEAVKHTRTSSTIRARFVSTA